MEIDRDILVRYFSGECAEEEKAAIHEWLESDKQHKREFIGERIRFDASLMIEEDEIPQSQPVRIKRVALSFLKIASAILILTGSSYLFNYYNRPEQVLQSVYVPAGSRTSVTLPDGSLVWLNSNTILTYPNTFSDKERTVQLDGEAYFEVTKDNARSFIVETDKYNVEVLGTTFNVEAYAKEQTFKTALFSGKVRLYREMEGESSLYLRPGEAAELIDGSLLVSSTSMDSYRWKDGLIILEDKSFNEIMRLFERYYDLQIIIENDKVKDLGYYGKLRIADGVDHALRVLQNDFRFTYKREERTNKIYIY